MEIRSATIDDAEGLLALRRRLFRETNFMLLEPGEFQSNPEDEGRFIRRVTEASNSCLLVALEGGEIAGFVAARGGEVNRNRHSALVVVGVARAHWSRGIASRLLDDVLAWGRAARLRRLELTVHVGNLRAAALYLRKGFEVEGRRRSSLRVEGRFVDEYLMSYIIEP